MYSDDFFEVAPHVGAWIEITDIEFYLPSPLVAPHVGAWIEILTSLKKYVIIRVAPHVGAWIEIPGRRHGRPS